MGNEGESLVALISNEGRQVQLEFNEYTHREVPIMLKQEAGEVIERIRDDLERHGVRIGYDPELTDPGFGCDLDYQVAQVRENPEKLVQVILIHDEGLWKQLRQGSVFRGIVSECQGKLFGIPLTLETRDDESYTIQFRH